MSVTICPVIHWPDIDVNELFEVADELSRRWEENNVNDSD
jgi:hypothetical protein